MFGRPCSATAVDDEAVDVVWVPGAFEIPFAAHGWPKAAGTTPSFASGAVIRGATPHFDYVCAETPRHRRCRTSDTGVPTIYGVITADTIEQAVERAGTKSGEQRLGRCLGADRDGQPPKEPG